MRTSIVKLAYLLEQDPNKLYYLDALEKYLHVQILKDLSLVPTLNILVSILLVKKNKVSNKDSKIVIDIICIHTTRY